MKQSLIAILSSLLLLAGIPFTAPSYADDRELQAILMKLRCVPSKIITTGLSPTLTAYEVTCRGSDRLIHIVCFESDCRQQLKPREEDDRE